MAEQDIVDRLDAAVDAMLARGAVARVPEDAELLPLWRVAADLVDLPSESFRKRVHEDLKRRAESMQQATLAPAYVPAGFRSLTPYLIVDGADAMIAFMKQAFGAEERMRVKRPDGTIQHAEVRVGDSVIELGDGLPAWPSRPAAIHLYVEDADATYARAAQAGAVTLNPPTDMPYGDREADVRDPFGNHWYIGTHQQGGPIPAGLHTVTPTLHVIGTDRLMDFIKRAFGAEELERVASPDGVVRHGQLKLGDSVLELGEARGFVPVMTASLHYYVEDTDAAYARALAAGGTSLAEPANAPYGDRAAGMADPFGNRWFLATRLR